MALKSYLAECRWSAASLVALRMTFGRSPNSSQCRSNVTNERGGDVVTDLANNLVR